MSLIREGVFALQIAVALVFLSSGVAKLSHAVAFARIVDGYRVLPSFATTPVAAMVVGAELGISSLLFADWHVRLGVSLGIALLACFGVAVALNLHRGRDIACGCFGTKGERISPRTLGRLGLLAVSLTLLVALRDTRPFTALEVGGISSLGYGTGLLTLAGLWIVIGAWILAAPELVSILRRRPVEVN